MKSFITFEGIDGSGKSTISKLVYKKLKSNGYQVVYTYEPTDTWIGKQVQKYIKTDTDPILTAFTFIADRREHGKQIEEWIKKGFIVICDRYAESTYAYQGAQLQGEINDAIRWLKELSGKNIPIPDRTFIFFIDPELSLLRIKNRNNLIPFERLSFLKIVHKNYQKLAVGKRFFKIDATKSIKEIVDLCYKDIIS
jgi:dTMP kinase